MTRQPPTFLVDGRWLGIGGPGRVTEHLLRGLGELDPPGTWLVWGSPEADELVWPGARRIPSRHHPHRWFGQREIPGPRSAGADVAIFPHQMRPGWRLAPAEVTTVHDTIPFRFPPTPALAPAMRVYLRWMATRAHVVCTVSEFSRGCIARDLGIPLDRIVVVPNPIDHESAARVRRERAVTPPEKLAVYIGADLPHKNLDRLLAAFAMSRFQAEGGRLALVGMDERASARLRSVALRVGATTESCGRLTQPDLEHLLARAAIVVQPSLEEGFGLPVAEAMGAGIPVAVSSGGSLPEITRGIVPTFDPTDVTAIAHAIDAASAAPATRGPEWATPLDQATAVHQAALRALDLVGRRGNAAKQ